MNASTNGHKPEGLERRPGRPTKFNEETIGRLCDALADGLPLKSACAIAGIGVQTLADWRDGDSELESRIARAREQFRHKALQTIGKAIHDGNWRAAAEALKMCFPEYRATSKLEVSATANTLSLVFSAEQQAQLQQRIAAAEAP